MDDASNPFAPLTPAELAEGARQIEQSQRERAAKPTCPPADAEPGAMAAARLYGRKPDGLWRYATADDETAFYVARWNEADGKKTFRPISWGKRAGWQFETWPDHRPLFNLGDLASNPNATVVICEGEKAAEAAAAIFPNSIATTSSGGAGAATKTDWTPLAGRSVLIWPDHDAAGEKYAREIAAMLAALDCSVAIIDAKALAAIDPAGGAREPCDKWDAADAIAEWPDLAALRKTAAGLRKAFDPGPAFVSYGAFEMGPDGLHVEVEKGRGENKTKASEWVAAPFEILGRLPRSAWAQLGQISAMARRRWAGARPARDRCGLARRSRAALRLACRRRLADQSGAATGLRQLPFGRARWRASDDHSAHGLA